MAPIKNLFSCKSRSNSMIRISLHGIFLACFAAGFFMCSTIPLTGTDTGNAMVVGRVFEPDSTTPADKAVVSMRLRRISFDNGQGPGATSAIAASAVTDSRGEFTVGSIDTGLYAVDFSDKANNLAFADSVHIIANVKNRRIPDQVLKPAGAIKGRIRLGEGGDPRKVFIVNYQADRIVQVDADGSFKLASLARGRYDLRFLPSLDNYDVFDTAGIVVKPGDTTDLGIITPRFTGIPTPQNVGIAYDTMKEIVTLTWAKNDTGLVKRYNIFRRDLDSGYGQVALNGTRMISDTIFRDSTVVQDRSYEYKIVAIDNGDNPGKMSAGVRTMAVSGFFISDTVITDEHWWSLISVFQNSRKEWIVGVEDGLFSYFGPGKPAASWKPLLFDRAGDSIKGDPSNSAIDNADTVYLLGVEYHLEQFWDYRWWVIKHYPDGTDRAIFSFYFGIRVQRMCLSGNTIFFLDNKNLIYAYSLTGDSLSSWGGYGTAPGKFGEIFSIAAGPEGSLLVADRVSDQPDFSPTGIHPTRVQRFASNGSLISTFYVPSIYCAEPYWKSKYDYFAGMIGMGFFDSTIVLNSVFNSYGFDLRGNFKFRYQLDDSYRRGSLLPGAGQEGIYGTVADRQGAIKLVMQSGRVFSLSKR
jgi:hypothetical protein